MNKIKITVEGTTGIGKTAVCQLIAETLGKKTLVVTSVPYELSAKTHYAELRTADGLEYALHEIRDRVEIDIVEKNIPRK